MNEMYPAPAAARWPPRISAGARIGTSSFGALRTSHSRLGICCRAYTVSTVESRLGITWRREGAAALDDNARAA
jgi:hypothetical protein